MISMCVPIIKLIGNCAVFIIWFLKRCPVLQAGIESICTGAGISMTRSSYQHNRYDFNVRADYKNTFNEKHNVLVTLVHNRQYYHGTSLSASSNTFYLSTIHQIQNGDAASITASNKESKQTSMGYVGRLRYDYDNRYMAEFSGRYDGSDCFPKGNRFGFFPSGSLGWAISEEEFFSPVKDLGIFDLETIKGRS